MRERSERTNSNGDEDSATAEPVVEYHDWGGDEPLGATVVDAASQVAGERGTTLPPLQECVDADALDALFRPNGRETPVVEGEVVFGYAGLEVTVYTTGFVVVRELPGVSADERTV